MLLLHAYWMEIETVMSYLANSVNPDGVRAQEIKESLERGHPGGARPRAAHSRSGSRSSTASSRARRRSAPSRPTSSRPTAQADVVHVIRGVIEAETGAIDHYNRIIEATDGVDPVTQDMVIDDPPRRGGPQAPVRGLPARVRGRGPRLSAPSALSELFSRLKEPLYRPNPSLPIWTRQATRHGHLTPLRSASTGQSLASLSQAARRVSLPDPAGQSFCSPLRQLLEAGEAQAPGGVALLPFLSTCTTSSPAGHIASVASRPTEMSAVPM